MLTDWLYLLGYPLRTARRAVPFLALSVVAVYFGLNALYSERGYFNKQRKQAEVSQAEIDLSILREERRGLEQRVGLLRGHAVGRDLLEEEARRVLNVAHPDDVVVRMPATADALFGSDAAGEGPGGSDRREFGKPD